MVLPHLYKTAFNAAFLDKDIVERCKIKASKFPLKTLLRFLKILLGKIIQQLPPINPPIKTNLITNAFKLKDSMYSVSNDRTKSP